MRILIGDTGFVGQNLLSFMHFDKTYNSKTIKDFTKFDHDIDIYLACLPATKWLVDKAPLDDLRNAENIVHALKKNTYNNVYLFSTIDVYKRSTPLSNESVSPKFYGPSYGANRYVFELYIRNNLQYRDIKVIRLPALFGPGLKKNILFDFKNNNQADKINFNSAYQWYNMERLEQDLNTISSREFKIFNLFPEPVETVDILGDEIGYYGDRIEYNFQTIHTPSGYWYDKKKSIKEIRKFLCK